MRQAVTISWNLRELLALPGIVSMYPTWSTWYLVLGTAQLGTSANRCTWYQGQRVHSYRAVGKSGDDFVPVTAGNWLYVSEVQRRSASEQKKAYVSVSVYACILMTFSSPWPRSLFVHITSVAPCSLTVNNLIFACGVLAYNGQTIKAINLHWNMMRSQASEDNFRRTKHAHRHHDHVPPGTRYSAWYTWGSCRYG